MIKNKNFKICHCTVQNKRDYNEDRLYINNIISTNNINIFCIFDGHGGKLVSEYLLNNIPNYMLNDDLDYEKEKIKIINQKIINYFEYIQCELEN